MFFNKKFFLEVYFLIFSFFLTEKIFNFFYPFSETHFYFSTLLSFNKVFLFNYLVNFMQIFFNTLGALFIFFYLKNISVPNIKILKCAFILRIVFDILGHPFDYMNLSAIYQEDKKIFLLLTTISLSFYLPSYIINYRYLFLHKTFKNEI